MWEGSKWEGSKEVLECGSVVREFWRVGGF